jgi:hypothetical protein
VRYSNNSIEGNEKMHRKSLSGLILVGLLLAASSSRTAQIRPQPTRAAAASEISVPFELVNRHIILSVQVNNSRPLSFVLDTGDKFAIIDLDRAKELGLKLEGQVQVGGAGAAISTGSRVQNSSFTIPGLKGFSQPVDLALPINRMAAKLGQDFDGIIGSDFIKQFVVEIDYQAKVIKLHDKSSFSYSGSGESIPMKLNLAGHPIIEGEVTPIGSESVKGKFVLDLGSGSALLLYTPFVVEHHLLSPAVKTIRALGVGGAGGAVTGQLGRVAEMKIGRFRISNPITMFSEDTQGALASSALLGNIGTQIASKFRIFLDYNHERIIFEPNSTFADSFDRAFSGLAVTAEGKDYRTFRISEVLENSPGSEVGLKKDDIISAIDSRPARQLTLTHLIGLFEQPIPYKLTVQRGGQTLQVTLTPRKLI